MMDDKMFCFQCEQTAGCTGCTGSAGVCGKSADTAILQDKLTGALVSLSRVALATKEVPSSVWKTLIEGLFTTITNVSFDDAAIELQTAKTHAETEALAAKLGAPINTADYDLEKVWYEEEDIRSLKSLILFGLRGMGAYAYHAWMLRSEAHV